MLVCDERVPAYLGRVLADADRPVGTCFQVAPGIFLTACHVLADLGLDKVGSVVLLDALAGTVPAFQGHVRDVDWRNDTAVLTSDSCLDDCVAGLILSDAVEPGTEVVVTGVVHINDPGHVYRYLDALGAWQGGTVRDNHVRLGRVVTDALMPGMSGAPVRRRSDDLVVGMVSARYNSSDGWLAHSGWIAGTESLPMLLRAVAHVRMTGSDPGKPFDVAMIGTPMMADWMRSLALKLRAESALNVLVADGRAPLGRWRFEPGRAQSQAECCLLVVGGDGSKGWYVGEVEAALALQATHSGLRIVPVLAPESVLTELTEFDELRTWADFRAGRDAEFAYRVITQAVKGLPLGVRPPEEPGGFKKKLMELEDLGRHLEREVLIETQRALMKKWLEEV